MIFRSRCMDKLYDLDDDMIYAISPDSMRYEDCYYCVCRFCMNMRDACKLCALCEYECGKFGGCHFFVPNVFRFEPYKSYFRELERLRGVRYDVIGRFE